LYAYPCIISQVIGVEYAGARPGTPIGLTGGAGRRIPAMAHSEVTLSTEDEPARRLTGQFARWAAVALAVIVVLWVLGFEAIVYHPTPFYALFRPAMDSAWTGAAAFLATWAAACGLARAVPGGRLRFVPATVLFVGAALLAGVLAYTSPTRGDSLPFSPIQLAHGLFPVLV